MTYWKLLFLDFSQSRNNIDSVDLRYKQLGDFVVIMGSALSLFHNYRVGFAPDFTNPGQKDWITVHAELTGLSIVEVERLWTRFQQLGCNEEGIIVERHIRATNFLKVATDANAPYCCKYIHKSTHSYFT